MLLFFSIQLFKNMNCFNDLYSTLANLVENKLGIKLKKQLDNRAAFTVILKFFI